MKKQAAANYSVAIYCRLSRDDETTGVSESIQNQQAMLTNYVSERSWDIYAVYIDDGFSGTNFERPAFKRMLQDIEFERVNAVVVKDLSRLGRNYILTGELTEIYFPTKGVRFIAVNDNFDSDSDDNDIAPFRHILNEMVARDTSRKVKSAFDLKKKNGFYFGAFAPFGYKKDPQHKGKLFVDEPAAAIVRRMFYLASIGYGSRRIKNLFNEEGILAPAVYRSTQYTHIPCESYTKSHLWSDQVVCDLLRNTTYLGHLSQGKTEKMSFKMKKVILKDKSDWVVHYNTHEPIIDQELWDIVQLKLTGRMRPPRGSVNLFAGITRCADCGYAMQYKKGYEKNFQSLCCSGYARNGTAFCTNHLTNYDSLYKLVLKQIKQHAHMTADEQATLVSSLIERVGIRNNDWRDTIADELEKAQKRSSDLDTLFMRLYEDNVSGVINKERFFKMSATYELEQSQLEEKVSILKADLVKETNHTAEYEQWLRLIGQYADIDELTQPILHELIERIEIGQRTIIHNGCRAERQIMQDITIYYRFVGKL